MSACSVPWPVCPSCPGARVWEAGGRLRCERCGTEWPTSARVPCPDPATVGLADAEGGGAVRLVCPSHAAHPSAGDLRRALRALPGGRGLCPACGGACRRQESLPLPPDVLVRAWSGPAFVCSGCGKAWTAAEVGERCEARSSTGLRCNLERGHGGVHEATGVEWLAAPEGRDSRRDP